MSTFASLREGAVILRGASVGPGSVIGCFCVVATAVVVAHDGRMADFSFLSANTVLGASLLGEEAFPGLGAVVAQGCSVGPDVVIGAQSFVASDIESLSEAYGAPARVSRRRARGDSYL